VSYVPFRWSEVAFEFRAEGFGRVDDRDWRSSIAMKRKNLTVDSSYRTAISKNILLKLQDHLLSRFWPAGFGFFAGAAFGAPSPADSPSMSLTSFADAMMMDLMAEKWIIVRSMATDALTFENRWLRQSKIAASAP
jgi:hypothetical protein